MESENLILFGVVKAVVQLVEELSYKLEDHEFDS
jgi:hypothetical protein